MLRYISILFFVVLLLPVKADPVAAGDLHIMVGSGIRQPVDKLISLFQERSDHRVFVDYAGSGHLLARIMASGQGDLFIPGSTDYIERLDKEGMVHSSCRIVFHTPVIGLNRDSAHPLNAFEDLASPGIRIAMGDPKAMAFGRIAMDILERSGMKEAILKNVVVYGATVKQLAMYVAQGDADAAIIGRADAIQFKDKIKIIPIPEEYFTPEIIAAALLKKAADRPEAVAFRDFMCSPEAVEVFKSFGFLPITGAEK